MHRRGCTHNRDDPSVLLVTPIVHEHFFYIILCFFVGRDFAISIHRVLACVIGRQGLPGVPVEPIQEVSKVLGPTSDVLVRIVEVTHAMADGGFWN